MHAGVCRTDLHVVDGELANPILSIIPGHEIVGRVDAVGGAVKDMTIGERVGIPPQIGIKVTTTRYPLNHANQALADLRAGRFEGAAVLTPDGGGS